MKKHTLQGFMLLAVIGSTLFIPLIGDHSKAYAVLPVGADSTSSSSTSQASSSTNGQGASPVGSSKKPKKVRRKTNGQGASPVGSSRHPRRVRRDTNGQGASPVGSRPNRRAAAAKKKASKSKTSQVRRRKVVAVSDRKRGVADFTAQVNATGAAPPAAAAAVGASISSTPQKSPKPKISKRKSGNIHVVSWIDDPAKDKKNSQDHKIGLVGVTIKRVGGREKCTTHKKLTARTNAKKLAKTKEGKPLYGSLHFANCTAGHYTIKVKKGVKNGIAYDGRPGYKLVGKAPGSFTLKDNQTEKIDIVFKKLTRAPAAPAAPGATPAAPGGDPASTEPAATTAPGDEASSSVDAIALDDAAVSAEADASAEADDTGAGNPDEG